jgi:peptidoglycan-N-acetylglucosamine deacetylase
MTRIRFLALALAVAAAAAGQSVLVPSASGGEAQAERPWSPPSAAPPIVPEGRDTAPQTPAPLDIRRGSKVMQEPAPPPPRTPPGTPAPAQYSGSAAEPVEGPGSAAILQACWSAAQLAGTDPERAIQGHLKPNREPPPDWAIQAAASASRPLPASLRGSIRGVEPADPEAHLVALTFDLCEGPNERSGYDGRIVDWLRANGVKATFFAGGAWMRDHPERALQLMADPLFELGNHGWTHGNLRVLHGAEARDQLLWTQAEYQVLREALRGRPCATGAGVSEWGRIPPWPTLVRFPFGACNEGSLDLTAELGLAAVQWTLVTGDPDRGRSAAAIAGAVREGVRHHRGAIVVAHANGRGWHTAESLPLFVPELREAGYRFVTLSELLAAGRPVVADSCYELSPGDNLRYDRSPKWSKGH